MNSSLRWLIWLAVLIGGWSITLDWQDELEKLRPERERLERLREREENAISAIDWQQLSLEAGKAQLAWLNRLPEVSQMGVFRAEAMETMADLCKRLDASCQVAAMGETSSSRIQPQGNAARSGNPATAAEPQGLVTTSVRVTTGLGDKLMPLLQEIENGSVLRKVEKFTVRSGRADFVVKTFGLDQQSATTTRNAAERQSTERKISTATLNSASKVSP